jgi:hypothetical protein
MKLRIQREDERIEIVTLTGDWRVAEGKHLNRIIDQSGFEHFFTHDGYYDGWGGSVRQPQEAADEVLESMEEKRQIEKVR